MPRGGKRLGSGRPLTTPGAPLDAQWNLRVPGALKDAYTARAEREGRTRDEIAREALRRGLE